MSGMQSASVFLVGQAAPMEVALEVLLLVLVLVLTMTTATMTKMEEPLVDAAAGSSGYTEIAAGHLGTVCGAAAGPANSWFAEGTVVATVVATVETVTLGCLCCCSCGNLLQACYHLARRGWPAQRPAASAAGAVASVACCCSWRPGWREEMFFFLFSVLLGSSAATACTRGSARSCGQFMCRGQKTPFP